jgi:hypothetical protein
MPRKRILPVGVKEFYATTGPMPTKAPSPEKAAKLQAAERRMEEMLARQPKAVEPEDETEERALRRHVVFVIDDYTDGLPRVRHGLLTEDDDIHRLSLHETRQMLVRLIGFIDTELTSGGPAA